MATNEKVNEYLGRIMHIRESKHANKMTRMRVDVYLDRERSLRYHKNEVSAQLRNNFEHVIE